MTEQQNDAKAALATAALAYFKSVVDSRSSHDIAAEAYDKSKDAADKAKESAAAYDEAKAVYAKVLAAEDDYVAAVIMPCL